jgi:hypothetical protein
MESIEAAVAKLGINDLTSALCQTYLDTPAGIHKNDNDNGDGKDMDNNKGLSVPMIDDINTIIEILSFINHLNIDMTSHSISLNIKKIGACALSTINNSTDPNGNFFYFISYKNF